jgi:hypothetical protein
MSERWHLSKTISVSHIATTATMIVLMIMYVTEIERDVAVLQSQQLATEKKFDSIDIKLEKIIDLVLEIDH